MSITLVGMLIAAILAEVQGVGLDSRFNSQNCTVKFDTEERRCSQFKKSKECCDSGNGHQAPGASLSEIPLVTSAPTSAHYTAMNVENSLQFSTPLMDSMFNITISDKIVLKLQKKESKTQKCWHLQALNETQIEWRERGRSIVLRGLVKDLADWKWAVYNERRCYRDEEVREAPFCEHFRNTSHTFEILPERELTKFRMITLDKHQLPQVKAELWSGSCPFTCNRLGTCKLNSTSRVMNITEDFQQNISVGYHCLRVHLIGEDGCVIYTETKEMKVFTPTNNTTTTYEVFTPLAIATSVVFAVVIVVVCLALKGHRRPGTSDPHADEGLCNVLIRQTPRVFLLYSRDSPQFCAAVEAFKTILEKCGTQVFDPFDDSQQDYILLNKESWLASLLEDLSVKIVFVLSEGAIYRQKALLAHKHVVSLIPHCLDSIFIGALNHIHHNMTLMNNYRRIFSVRFEDSVLTDLNPSLTPLSRFTMLRDFPQLLNEIRGNQHPWSRDPEQSSAEFDNFVSKMQDMIRVREENYPVLHSFVEITI